MMRKLSVIFCVISLAALVAAPVVLGHEFIIKPMVSEVEPGTKLPFSIVSAHQFMVSEEMEPLKQVEVRLVSGNGDTALPLKENDMLMTLDGQAEPAEAGTSILAGHRKGIIWTNTTQGWKEGSKKGLTGVISSGLYEKFAKTIITVGKSNDGYQKVVGQRLEIVPVDDPAKARVGDYLAFKILFDGQPMATEVWATYDGFANVQNTYAYYTETNGENLALVKISHPGLWMVRAQKKLDQQTEDYDSHVMRAVLAFEVR